MTQSSIQVQRANDELSTNRDRWIRVSSAYYQDLSILLNFLISGEMTILEVGCSTGWLIDQLNTSGKKIGVDVNPSVIAAAANCRKNANTDFICGDFETIDLGQQFDFIILSDVIPFAYDAQNLMENAVKHLAPGGRIFLSTYNSYLKPAYSLAEKIGLKQKSTRIDNWFTKSDILNIAKLANLESIKSGTRAIIPWSLSGLGRLINRFLAPIPIFSFTNLYFFTLLRSTQQSAHHIKSVTVVVPARNEAGNIEAAVTRLPKLADSVELIFVEGNSTDNTWQVIQEVAKRQCPEWLTIKIAQQTGKGKANAVHEGFAIATGEILMILDADLTVPPEDLPRFLKPIQEGTSDFVHGNRLVYPMEGEAMRFLNILGNKFFSLAFSFLLGQPFKDTLCGTKVMRRLDWAKILKLRAYFGDFDPFGDFEMLFGAIKLNLKIAEIPIHYKARTYGTTNISRFRHGLILLKMVIYAAPKMKFI